MPARRGELGLSLVLLAIAPGCPDPQVPSTSEGSGDSTGGGSETSMSASDSGMDDATVGGSGSGGQGCGNGIVEGDEQCDDGGESATCDADCTVATCGDAVVNAMAGETCDEGGETATCNADCSAAACGDGVLNATAGEECDGRGETADCDADCTAAECGDGVSNAAAGEECDDGRETATCDVDCTAAMCGDGTFNMTAGEECDDGGLSPACDDDCTNVTCGDGVLNPNAGEMCDDGGESPMCNSDCTPASCGDGVTNMAAGEDCDTMGESMTCDADCTTAECGDLFINETLGEECDDTNLDGQTCQSLGYQDGVLACGMACTYDFSGCSAQCPPFIAASIDADATATTPSLATTGVSIAWDGASLWTASGGNSGGLRLVELDAMGAELMAYTPGLDLRSVFTLGDGTTPLYARSYNNATLHVQMAPGMFMNDVTLVGGSLDLQASVVWHPIDDRFVAHNNGTIDRWDATGAYTDSIVLIGYGMGNESMYPQNRGVAFGGGCYLTFDDGNLSSWDPMGNRVDTIVLNQAIPGDFGHNFTVSFARGRVWHGTVPDWHGYDVFGTAP